jgi:uncharacterized membrane-anchored protein
MKRDRLQIVCALIFPVFMLASLTLGKASIRLRGNEIVLPVRGYDPRDLLSGHYLIYTVDYGISDICAPGPGGSGTDPSRQIRVWLCLEGSRYVSLTEPKQCRLRLRGRCERGFFSAGIERLYVPQEKAAKLESLIQGKSASILINVSEQGEPQVKDLLIDGVSWRSLDLDDAQ